MNFAIGTIVMERVKVLFVVFDNDSFHKDFNTTFAQPQLGGLRYEIDSSNLPKCFPGLDVLRSSCM